MLKNRVPGAESQTKKRRFLEKARRDGELFIGSLDRGRLIGAITSVNIIIKVSDHGSIYEY
jgi:hypothetical protein